MRESEPRPDSAHPSQPGCLYVVATPIGNLEDLTLRAQRILGEVDWVACEDTRRTGALLSHLGLHRPLFSLWQCNEVTRTRQLLARLQLGEQGALVSDGGTPLISDPGSHLVREARAAGLRVVPVPGPSAAIAALSASGLPTETFLFLGFLSRTPGKLRRRLACFRDVPATLVVYESPERIVQTLRMAQEALGARRCVIARELTKLHEEFLSGSPEELAEQLSGTRVRGEVTLLIAARQEEEVARAESVREEELVEALRAELARGLSARDAAGEIANRLGVQRRQTYALAVRLTSEPAMAGSAQPNDMTSASAESEAES